MNSIAVAVAVAIASTTLGCGASSSGFVNAAIPTPGVAISHVDATERGIIAVRSTSGSPIRVCPEPPPDVAITDSRSFALAAEAALQQVDVSADVRREVMEQLSQINPTSEATTYLRSALIQMCWLAANTDLSSSDVAEMYRATILESRAVAYREVVMQFIRMMQAYVAAGQVDNEELVTISKTLALLILQSAPEETRQAISGRL